MPPMPRKPNAPVNGEDGGPPSSNTSENVQNDIMSTFPSHWRTVFASAGPTKVVSRDSFKPCTFHSVQNNGSFGWEDALISPRTFLIARQTRSSCGTVSGSPIISSALSSAYPCVETKSIGD